MLWISNIKVMLVHIRRILLCNNDRYEMEGLHNAVDQVWLEVEKAEEYYKDEIMKKVENIPDIEILYNGKVHENTDKHIVDSIRSSLKKKDGYCPCRATKNEDTRCLCKEFRDQIADPDFEGFCHCKLYYKEK